MSEADFVHGNRRVAVYPVTGEELILLKRLPWWARRELIDHIMEATDLSAGMNPLPVPNPESAHG